MVQTRSALKRKGTHDVEKDNRGATNHGLSLTPSTSFDDLEDVNPQDDLEYEPAKKRRKRHQNGQPAKRSRRRGKLEMMPQMNLDVLFHIFSFLHPMGLLNLARTTKAFRRLLMQKSSAFIWKTCRLQIEGFPDCPDDLSEPQFINLAFYPHCHNCGKIAPTILWRIRRRYCPSCRVTRLQHSGRCSPPLLGGTILPEEELSLDTNYSSPYVDVVKYDALREEYRSIPEDKKEEFLKNKHLETSVISKHARECHIWLQKITDARKRELQRAREAREDEIFNRIIDLGYEAVIEYYGRSEIRRSEPSLFRTSKPLTSKEWNRMRPILLNGLDGFQESLRKRLLPIRREALDQQYDRFIAKPASPGSDVDILPHVADIATFAPFVEITDAPPRCNYKDVSFESAFEQLPAFVKEWRAKVEVQLASLVVFPPDPSDASESRPEKSDCDQEAVKAIDRLKLASAVFAKKGSDQLMVYPDILLYPLFYSPTSLFMTRWVLTCKPWSLYDGNGVPVVQVVAAAAHVVRACGLDPELATVDDMEQRDARLICNLCSPTLLVRTWRNAVRHSLQHSTSTGKGDWTLVDDRYLKDIKAVEKPPAYIKGPGQRIDYTQCLACRKRAGDMRLGKDVVEQHLRTMHKLDRDPEEGVDWIRILNAWLDVEEVVMIQEGDLVKFEAL